MSRCSLLVAPRRPGGRAHTWLGIVLVLAIALRLLVPQGWMPDARGGLMLCPGQMPAAAVMHGGHGGKHEAPAKHMPDSPCAYAALGLATTPLQAAAALPVPLPAAKPVLVPTFTVAIGRGLAAPPPPATGPPAFA